MGVIMNIIEYHKIGSNKVRITRYYPPITHSCLKYLIELYCVVNIYNLNHINILKIYL